MRVLFTAEELGFAELEPPPDGPEGRGGIWGKRVGGRDFAFRTVRDLASLAAVEALQRAVFAGIADVDVAGPGMLVAVAETGGEVIGAYRPGASGEDLVGFVTGWGGYVAGRPRLLSDMLGVRADVRGGGLGAELKKLQAAVAIRRGFLDVVWTVDPLRAANARLNFEKLGAYADRYELDRYGAEFATDLYGGLPTDRLHVTWPLDSPLVHDRLLGRTSLRTAADVAGVPLFDPTDSEYPAQVLVPIPADVDRLLAANPDDARDWRYRVRTALTAAFAAGYAIVGFAGAIGLGNEAALLLERRDVRREGADPA
jgi:predicted GNAT superfamily acetyltransferase